MLANKSHLLHSIMVNYTQLEPFTACSLFTVPRLTQAFFLPHTAQHLPGRKAMRLQNTLKGNCKRKNWSLSPAVTFLFPSSNWLFSYWFWQSKHHAPYHSWNGTWRDWFRVKAKPIPWDGKVVENNILVKFSLKDARVPRDPFGRRRKGRKKRKRRGRK